MVFAGARPDSSAYNFHMGPVISFRSCGSLVSLRIRFVGVCMWIHAFTRTRFHSHVSLECRLHLRRRRSAWIRRTTCKRLREGSLRTPDGTPAPILPARALETSRQHLRIEMRRLSARYAQLIRMCRRRGCSREDARDLVQEAHLRLFDYARSTRVRDVDSLLRRIVINLSITHFHRELSTPFTFESVSRLDRRGLLVDPTPGPERTVAAEQELDQVVTLLNGVSPRTCQIFIAQRVGYSYAEIAAAFAVKPPTVDKHVATATLILTETGSGGLAGP